MKKITILSVLMIAALAAAAAPKAGIVKTSRTDARSINAKANVVASQTATKSVAKELPTTTVAIGTYGFPVGIADGEEADPAVLAYRYPRASFVFAYDPVELTGYPGRVLMPAYVPLTWENNSTGATSFLWAFQGQQFTTDGDLEAAAFDGTYYMPYLYDATNTDNVFRFSQSVMGTERNYVAKVGGDHHLVFSDGVLECPVSPTDLWTDNLYGSINGGYNSVNVSANYDARWLTNLRNAYGDTTGAITNAKLNSLLQLIEKPASPYILTSLVWPFYINNSASEEGHDITVNIKKASDGTLLATSSIHVAPQAWGRVAETFAFETETEGGDIIDGVIIDDAVFIEIAGIHADGIDNFLAPFNVYADPYIDQMMELGAYANVTFDYNGQSGYNVNRRCSFGYYMDEDEDYDSVGYVCSYSVYMNVNYPYIYSDVDSINANVAGETTDTIAFYAGNASEEWEIVDENGNELPEWVTYALEDYWADVEETDDDGNVVNTTTVYDNVTAGQFTIEALPEGTDYREVTVVCAYPSFAAPAVKKTIVICQGEKPEPGIKGDVNGDGEVTVGDVSAIYDIMLGLSENYKDRADVNGDGEITVGDVSAVYDIMLGIE